MSRDIWNGLFTVRQKCKYNLFLNCSSTISVEPRWNLPRNLLCTKRSCRRSCGRISFPVSPELSTYIQTGGPHVHPNEMTELSTYIFPFPLKRSSRNWPSYTFVRPFLSPPPFFFNCSRTGALATGFAVAENTLVYTEAGSTARRNNSCPGFD